MRWLCCSLALVAAGCMNRGVYRMGENDPRITLDEMRTRADTFLQVECPRLMGNRQSALGAMQVVLDVDRRGEVQRVQREQSTGDDRLDRIFGGYAAQLKFDPPTGMTGDQQVMNARLVIGYSCSPTAAASTLELKR